MRRDSDSTAMRLTLKRRIIVPARMQINIDGSRVEAVEVEELGIGQEVQVIGAGEAQVAGGELVRRRDSVEVGDVLRHVWRTPACVGCHLVLIFGLEGL